MTFLSNDFFIRRLRRVISNGLTARHGEATRKGSIKRQNEFVYHANRERERQRESTQKNLINYLPFGLISRKIATRVRTLRLVFPPFTL